MAEFGVHVLVAVLFPKGLKPFTFFAKVSSGVQLTKHLVQKFSKSKLGSVQDFTEGKYEIFLKTHAVVERFLQDLTLKVKVTKIVLEYWGTHAKVMHIFGYSSEHQDVELTSALQLFRKTVHVSQESVPDFLTATIAIRQEMRATPS